MARIRRDAVDCRTGVIGCEYDSLVWPYFSRHLPSIRAAPLVMPWA